MRFHKCIIINSTLDGNVHEIFDSSIIIVLSRLFQKVEVRFPEQRIENLKKIVCRENVENIDFIPQHIIGIGEKGYILKNLIRAGYEIFQYVICKGDLFVFTYRNMFTVSLINLLSFFIKKNTLMFCHSELQTLLVNNYNMKNITTYLYNRQVKYEHIRKNIRHVVLGDYILDTIRECVAPFNTKFFLSFDHPYMGGESLPTHKFPSVISIGIIGKVDNCEKSGYKNILSFAKAIGDYKNVQLYIISKVSEDFASNLPHNISVLSRNGQYLTRDEYEKKIKDLDYVFIPYPKESYRILVSGSILEAISKNKPILSYGNGYFEYLFNKYGEIGINIDNMQAHQIMKVISDQSMYERICYNQNELMKIINPEAMSKQMRTLLNNNF